MDQHPHKSQAMLFLCVEICSCKALSLSLIWEVSFEIIMHKIRAFLAMKVGNLRFSLN